MDGQSLDEDEDEVIIRPEKVGFDPQVSNNRGGPLTCRPKRWSERDERREGKRDKHKHHPNIMKRRKETQKA